MIGSNSNNSNNSSLDPNADPNPDTQPFAILAYLRLDNGLIVIDHCHDCKYNQFAVKDNFTFCGIHSALMNNPMVVRMALTVTNNKILEQAMGILKAVDDSRLVGGEFSQDRIG